MIQRTGLGIGCALAAASCYGFIPNLARLGFINGVPGIEATLLRTSLIAIVLAVGALAGGESLHLPRPAWRSFLGQTVATALVSVTYLWSVQYIAVGLAVVVFFTFPIAILLIAPIVEGSRPGLFSIAIACLAFAGLAIALGPHFERIDPRGLALAFLSAAGATLQFFSGRAISRYLPPATFGSLVHIAIWPVTLAIALWSGGGRLAILSGVPNPAGYAAALGLAAVYIIAYFVHMQSLRNAPASTVAPFYNLEPVVTTLVAAVLLGERLAPHQYVGGAMVLAALLAPGVTAALTALRHSPISRT